jgi:hypothetical protein
MPVSIQSNQIAYLLNILRDEFPQVKSHIDENSLNDRKSPPFELDISPPDPFGEIPTFDSTVSHALTPQLKTRFTHSGSWLYGTQYWLSPMAMREWIDKPNIRKYHQSLRENWEGSAPNVVPDDRLSLLEVGRLSPDSVVYLVWAEDSRQEPQVWRYSGMESAEYTSLEEYLKWLAS